MQKLPEPVDAIWTADFYDQETRIGVALDSFGRCDAVGDIAPPHDPQLALKIKELEKKLLYRFWRKRGAI